MTAPRIYAPGPPGPTGPVGTVAPATSYLAFLQPAVGATVVVTVDDASKVAAAGWTVEARRNGQSSSYQITAFDGGANTVTLRRPTPDIPSAPPTGATIDAGDFYLTGRRGATGASGSPTSFLWLWTRPSDALAATGTAAAEVPPIMLYDQGTPWNIGVGIVRFTMPVTPSNTNFATFTFGVYDSSDALLGAAFEVATTVTNLGAGPVSFIDLTQFIGAVTTFGDGNSIRPSVTKTAGGVQISQTAVSIRIDAP